VTGKAPETIAYIAGTEPPHGMPKPGAGVF